MSHFNASKVIVIGGTGGPNSLEKTMYGNPDHVNRGNYVRKSVVEASGSNNEDLTKSNALCERCASVFGEDGDWGESEKSPSGDHYTFPGLLDSAEKGCHLCILLLNHIPEKSYELLKSRVKERLEQPRLRLRVRRREFSNDRFVDVKYCAELIGFDLEKYIPYGYKPDIGGFSAEVILEPQKPEAVPVCPGSIDTSSDESLSQISAWIKTCSKSHPLCACKQTHVLPTRLIDVGDRKTTKLRIVESKILAPDTQYLTLSHCWGKAPLSKLLMEDWDAYKQELPPEKLPRTFLDSISLTRRLGMRYIWIDALCILQDSKADWKHESRTMGLIYSKSYLNIAASASSDGQGGLFHRRDPLAAASCTITPSWPNWSQEPLVCYDQVDTHSEVYRSVLNERAWVLQERLLASRAVNFTEKQIWWTCRTMTASETYPNGYPMEDDLNKWNLWKEGALVHGDAERGKLCLVWDKIVLEYTRRKLTYESDKLVALSGLAKEVNREYGGIIDGRSVDYLAGIWSVAFTRGLLWSTKGIDTSPDHCPRRSKEYRAPSWSWASIEGPIAAPTENIDCGMPSMRLINVPEAKTSALDDPYGAVTHGFMVVTGPLCKVPAGLCLPVFQLHPFYSPGTSQLAHGAGETFIFWDDWTPEVVENLTSETFYLLGCQCVFTGPESLMYGLVLTPAGPKGQFRRVGYFDYLEPSERELKHPWNNIMKLLGAERPTFDHFDTKFVENGLLVYSFSVV